VTAFIVISDTHTGHKNGLVNPDSELEDGVPVPLYPVPESLWDIVITAADFVQKNCKKEDVHLIHMGETVQGNKYTDSLLTAEMSLQFKLAKDTLKPFITKNLKSIRFLQATSWHEYGDGSASKLMRELIKAKHQIDVKQMNQSRVKVGDLLFEWTHHGSATSKRYYLQANSAFLDAKDRVMFHNAEKIRCPDITFTAHTHKPSKATASILSEGEYVSNTQVITPPMCGPGAYSRKVANPSIYYVGCHVVLTDGRGFEVIPFYKRLFDYDMEVL